MSFYPHARVGRDKTLAKIANHRANFLSARPVRGATQSHHLALRAPHGFYPHAPCGARLSRWASNADTRTVSIRTPRAGRDSRSSTSTCWRHLFLSARPGRGATHVWLLLSVGVILFLSARPGRGATQCSVARYPICRCFYPHAPGGARRSLII